MGNQRVFLGRFNLRIKIILFMVGALTTIMAIVLGFLYGSLKDELNKAYAARGRILTRYLATESELHIQFSQKNQQQSRLKKIMDQHDSIEYILVLKSDGIGDSHQTSIFSVRTRREFNIDNLIELHMSHMDHFVEQDNRLAFTEPIVSGGSPDGGLGGDGKEDNPLEGGGKILGFVCLGMSTTELNHQKYSVMLTLLAWMAGALLVFALLVYLASNLLNRRLVTIMDVAQRISTGDLSEPYEEKTEDEIGAMAEALNKITSNLNDMMRQVASVADSLGDAVEQITASTSEVARGAEHQVSAVDETSSSMSQMIVSLKGIAENVEVLATSAEESSSSILEMAATNDEMADNIHSLATNVEQTTNSMDQMTRAIKDVANSVEELSTVTEQTSFAMHEMNMSISQVENNAENTANLSEEVRGDAERGAEAVKKTIQGISRINDTTQQAFSVMEALGKKVQAIGQVLTVIDDVTEQTNLLALNAAIIAAQAGEHGKGFAVVADEIKDLAERTAASTSEIGNLIQAVQSETKNVLDTMHRGLKSVEEGVGLSNEAELALRKIVESTSKSTQMVREIAQATVEQARGSKEVTNSISRIAEAVQQIASATAQQAKGSEQIMSSAERMRVVTQHVHASSQEQARGSKQITRAIENISEMVNHLSRAQREQARGAEQVLSAVERIKGIAEQNSEAMERMKQTVDMVTEQANTLLKEISHFKL